MAAVKAEGRWIYIFRLSASAEFRLCRIRARSFRSLDLRGRMSGRGRLLPAAFEAALVRYRRKAVAADAPAKVG
jgi:hypothetical protein